MHNDESKTVVTASRPDGDWISQEYVPGLVSVIIPTYDRAKYLVDAMNSVWNQTYRPIELIVIDDGSQDDTLAVVDKWAKQADNGPQFRVRLTTQQNQGAQVARNRGLAQCHGQYIKFLDSDDIIGHSTIEAQAQLLSSCAPQVAVFSNWQFFRERHGRIELFSGEATNVGLDALASWIGGWYVPSHSVLWRRQDAIRLGPWDETLAADQDGEYMMRFLLLGGRLKLCSDAWVYYRSHKDTVGRKASLASLTSRVKVTEKVEMALAQRRILEGYRPAIARRYYAIARRAAALYPDVASDCLKKFRELSPDACIPGTIGHRFLVMLVGLTLKEQMAKLIRSYLDLPSTRPLATVNHVSELYCGGSKT